MSFTAIVKSEIIKLKYNDLQKISLLAPIINNNSTITNNIEIKIENINVAKLVYKLLQEMYRINPKITIRNGYNYRKKMLYILDINNNVSELINSLGLNYTIPPNFLYDDEELIKSYLTGLFLSCGSINDPKTSRYHLEFVVDNKEYAGFISKQINYFNLNSKVLKRENKFMIYIKEAEKISDFLRIMNVVKSLLYYEDIRIYRDNINMTNRLNNCEQANMNKIILTSYKQVEQINIIKENDLFDLLDIKTKEAAIYRLKYQEVSLNELSEIISIETGNRVTKSGLYHRFKKIKELYKKIKKTS